MKRVLVLGTGTGVGKTYVTASLARALRSAAPSLPLLAMKPVETGVTGPSLPSDHATLAEHCHGIAPCPPLHLFPEPLSPHLAARRAGSPVAPAALVNHVLFASNPPAGVCLVETAGGAFTPLATGFTNAALALALDPAYWILVAPDSLGVLHDVTATLQALRTLARPPDALVLSAARPADPSTGTNVPELTALGIWSPVHHLPRDDPSSLAALAAAILRGPT